MAKFMSDDCLLVSVYKKSTTATSLTPGPVFIRCQVHIANTQVMTTRFTGRVVSQRRRCCPASWGATLNDDDISWKQLVPTAILEITVPVRTMNKAA